MSFVLVHGGGFAGSCWDLLVPLLEPPVLAVDLPGRGDRPAAVSTVRVSDFVNAVVEDIVELDLTDVVLVGHSLAGITLPGVAARVPDRLRRVVFISCSVPPHGVSVADVLDTFSPAAAEVASRIGGSVVSADGTLHPDLAREMFCNDMDADQCAFTLARQVREALGVISEPVDLSGLRQSIPMTYVRPLRDASLTFATQQRMTANLGGVDVIDLDAGHMAMISQPAELARILNAL
jgi:pimeloyl-ACP methyl ester carboxylesterase